MHIFLPNLNRPSLDGVLSALLLLSLAVTGGCRRDRNKQKQEYFQSGMAYFQKARLPEAVIQFQNAVKIDPNFAPAHYELAQCYLQQHLWLQALREFKVTIQLDPKNAQAQLDLGGLLLQNGQFRDAKDLALAILKNNPSEVKAQLLLATSDGDLGNYPEAISEAEQAVSMTQNQASPYFTLGVLQAKTAKFSDAESNLRKAISLDPKFLASRMALGNLYLAQKRFADAETEYRAAIDVAPQSPVTWAALSSLYVAWGKKDLAEQNLRDAKKMMPAEPDAYRLLGEYYIATNDLSKARTEFAELLQEHPKDLLVKKQYIQLLVPDKQYSLATRLCDEILKENRLDADALIAKGHILNLEKKPLEATPLLESAVRINSENAMGHLQLGVAYGSTGKLDLSEREFREALKYSPSLLEAKQNLAHVALVQRNADLLEKAAEEWVKADRSSAQAYLARGTARLWKGNAPGAQADLLKSIELAPQNPTSYARMGDLRLAQKRYAEAEKAYETALSQDPRASDALQSLVGLFLLQNQPEKALQRTQAQVERVPDNSTYRLLLGEALLANHKSPEARAAFEKAIELDKGNLNAVFVLAQLQEVSGESGPAEANYQRILQVNPQDVRTYLALGSLEEKRGNWQKAEEIYRGGLKAQPNQPAIANNLSFLLLEHGGNVPYALSLAQTARQGMPESPNTADTLGWAFYKMGVYDSAVEMLQEAAKKVPHNPTYYYHLGLACQKANKIALAKSSLQRALQLDPKSSHSEEIHKALSELDETK